MLGEYRFQPLTVPAGWFTHYRSAAVPEKALPLELFGSTLFFFPFIQQNPDNLFPVRLLTPQNMKKLINSPENIVLESITGLGAAFSDLIKIHTNPNYITRARRSREK